MHIERDNTGKDITIYELEFKGSRKDYYVSPDNLSIKPSDHVIVQADRGEHIGRVHRSGPRAIFPQAKELKSIIRHASYTDMQIVMDNRRKESEAFKVCQQKIAEHELKMKLVDVEYQFDGNKICFYFTADKRIDFRALVKDLAAEYRTRIELRQIGVRDEARRLGGLGVCGRPLCCKTFLTSFEPITSQMARDQNLSLSPSKISGLCGRLMCCLAFEEDFYKYQTDILPSVGAILEKDGTSYRVNKVDIFNDTFIIADKNGTENTIGIDEYSGFIVKETPRMVERESVCKRCDTDDSPSENIDDNSTGTIDEDVSDAIDDSSSGDTDGDSPDDTDEGEKVEQA